MLMLFAIAFIAASVVPYWLAKALYGRGTTVFCFVVAASYLSAAIGLAIVVALAAGSGYGPKFTANAFGQNGIIALLGPLIGIWYGRRTIK